MFIETDAVVLKNIRYSDSDSILILFTKKLGKVSAIAKGSRRSNSKLLACSQPFTYGSYMLYKSSSMFNISQCDVKDTFFDISKDLKTLSYASYVLNLTKNVVVENQTNNRLFALLLKTLYCYAYKEYDFEYVTRLFELKYLDYIGYRPEVTKCVSCGSKEGIGNLIQPENGSCICSDCASEGQPHMRIDPTTLELMRYITGSDFNICVKAKVSPFIVGQLKKVLRLCLRANVDGYEEQTTY